MNAEITQVKRSSSVENRSPSIRRRLMQAAAASLLFAAAAASPLHAANFCVSDAITLQNALGSAQGNNEDDVIKIEYGTLTSTLDLQAPQNYRWILDDRWGEHAITISGGWSKGNGCASIATTSPEATVLDAQYHGPVFAANLTEGYSGQFTMRNLTLAHGKSFDTSCRASTYAIHCASGLGIEMWGTSTASVTIENVLIRDGRSDAWSVAPIVRLWAQDGGSLRFRNNIVMNNDMSAGPAAGRQGVVMRALSNSILYISNNSIFGNTVRGTDVGLIVTGVANLYNNAVADNVAVGGSTPIQFVAHEVYSMTLRNNHFGSVSLGGIPFSEAGTTTGDAQWTPDGYGRMLPDVESVLRDSGNNSPLGGIPAVDFIGNARVINSVIDRGAMEAAAVPPLGPIIIPNSPNSGSTTAVYGSAGGSAQRLIDFFTGGGTLNGTTELLCGVIAGTAQITGNGSQHIATGGSVQPVGVSLPITNAVQVHTVMCTATRLNGPVSTYFFHYRVATDMLLSNGFE